MARPWTSGRPAAPAQNFTLSPILSPLEPYKKYVSSFGNLENAATAGSVHSFTPSTWLSCTRPDTGGARAHMAVTLDQVIAKVISQDTPLPSLEVASETIVQTSAGNNSIYTTLSFRDADSPLPMETNPRKVFLQLFGEGDTPQERAAISNQTGSILDLILDDTRKLQGRLGNGDRAVLDGYLESVREIERRAQMADAKDLSALKIPNAPVGEQEDFGEQVKLMFDLIALAYQADLTRVVAYVTAAEGTNRTYNHIGIADAFHPMSHHANDLERLNKLAKIQTWHVEKFAEFLAKMAATPDGRGHPARSLDLHVRVEHEQQRPARQLSGAEHPGWGRKREGQTRRPAPGIAGENADRESPPDAAAEGRCRARQVRRQHWCDCGHLENSFTCHESNHDAHDGRQTMLTTMMVAGRIALKNVVSIVIVVFVADVSSVTVPGPTVDRRHFVKAAAAVALPLWGSARLLAAQQPVVASGRLTESLVVLDVGGSNVLCSSADPQGLVLVDSGAAMPASQLSAALQAVRQDAKVQTVFNTHYHADQTGNNETLAEAGARIIAHEHARQWMSTDYWVPAENRYEKARAQSGLAHGHLPRHRLVENRNRADRLWPPAAGSH